MPATEGTGAARSREVQVLVGLPALYAPGHRLDGGAGRDARVYAGRWLAHRGIATMLMTGSPLTSEGGPTRICSRLAEVSLDAQQLVVLGHTIRALSLIHI